MCLLILASPNKTPKKSELNCACDNNPDGFGFAFHLGDKIITGHSLNKNNAIKRFFKLREKYPESYALFHARYATTGSVKIENCHPYNIGNKNSVLAHNGVLPIKPENGDDRSDTKIFAEDYLTELGLENLDNPEFFADIEKFCSGSKLVIFTTETKMKYGVYVINEHLGHKKNGVWYSNYSYCEVKKIDTYKTYDYRKYSWYDLDETENLDTPKILDVCSSCFTENTFDTQNCVLCGACLDCGENKTQCLCYIPTLENHNQLMF